ncbi:hypothetical protein B0H16DRAFT_254152 [Mycena metata]|uniref:DUF6534 domain-containing protein n=1 Tax=Mycena metata TaxID=1033252 RepID=A0AAD7NNV6_9AGAR|nr:hypothetical protein B0H16DRAFT_254152 [Mycena metata]
MSSSTSTSTTLPNYAPIVTPQLLGSLLNFFYYGTLVVQVYIYRLCFPKDSLLLKCIVYFILLAMTTAVCLNAADVEYWFGAGFGDISRLASPHHSRFTTPILGSFVALIVHLFFVYRVLALTTPTSACASPNGRRHIWTWFFVFAIVGVALAQAAGGMASGIISYMSSTTISDEHQMRIIYVWLVGRAVADLGLAVVMTYLLLKSEDKSAKGDIVKRTVRLCIESNGFTAVVSLVALILFLSVPNTTYFICPIMIIPEIYANTLLVVLNTRPHPGPRAGGDDPDSELTTSTLAFNRNRSSTNATAVSKGDSVGTNAKGRAVYSANSPGRVLSVPAMSFARRPQQDVHGDGEEDDVDVYYGETDDDEKRPRSSVENQWRADQEARVVAVVHHEPGNDEDSGSEYESDGEGETRV